jgi:hypothetical protein
MERRKSNTDPKIKSYRAKLMNLAKMEAKYREMTSHLHQRWFSMRDYNSLGYKIDAAKKEIEELKTEIYGMARGNANEEEADMAPGNANEEEAGNEYENEYAPGLHHLKWGIGHE